MHRSVYTRLSSLLNSRLILIVLVVLLVLTSALPALAQPGMPGAPTQSPIDGGLALLALAGTGYAVRKLRRNEK